MNFCYFCKGVKGKLEGDSKFHYHSDCIHKAKVVSCNECNCEFVVLGKTDWRYHPKDWTQQIYDDGTTNEAVLCADCAKPYDGILAGSSNKDLIML